jgi:tripeptide aminopeptidase
MEFLVNNPISSTGKSNWLMKKLDVVRIIDVAKFGADWAYTMDGSQIGELEYENFNAAGAKNFQGKAYILAMPKEK